MAEELFRKIPEKKLTNIDQATLVIPKKDRKIII